jgi:hypothetical protein
LISISARSGISGARGVLQHGLAIGQGRGHHQVLGAGHGDHVGRDARARRRRGRPHLRCQGLDVAVLHGDLGAHGLQALDVLVHRPRADGAAAGQRHLGRAEAGQQRPSTRMEARMVLTSS